MSACIARVYHIFFLIQATALFSLTHHLVSGLIQHASAAVAAAEACTSN